MRFYQPAMFAREAVAARSGSFFVDSAATIGHREGLSLTCESEHGTIGRSKIWTQRANLNRHGASKMTCEEMTCEAISVSTARGFAGGSPSKASAPTSRTSQSVRRMPVREGSNPSTCAPSPGFISRTGTPRSHAKHSSLRRFDLFAGGSASVVGNLGCEAKRAVFDPKVFRQRWRLSSRYCLASPRRPSSVNSVAV